MQISNSLTRTFYSNIITITTVLFLSFVCGCGKEGVGINRIDVSNQWQVDENGGFIRQPSDDQWQQKTFTREELDLFSSLDTVSLSGTIKPALVNSKRGYSYPNPFKSIHAFPFACEPTYKGTLVFKYVIVDKKMKALFATYSRIPFANGNRGIALLPEVPAGQYRVYYTFSAAGSPHFYQSWGNVEKQ